METESAPVNVEVDEAGIRADVATVASGICGGIFSDDQFQLTHEFDGRVGPTGGAWNCIALRHGFA